MKESGFESPHATRDRFKLDSKALFSSIFFFKIHTVALSFVFDKYYLIMD